MFLYIKFLSDRIYRLEALSLQSFDQFIMDQAHSLFHCCYVSGVLECFSSSFEVVQYRQQVLNDIFAGGQYQVQPLFSVALFEVVKIGIEAQVFVFVFIYLLFEQGYLLVTRVDGRLIYVVQHLFGLFL